jgi:hypothetical protein
MLNSFLPVKVKVGKGELLPFLTTHVACGSLVATGVKIEVEMRLFLHDT